jgi:hypothetical protein
MKISQLADPEPLILTAFHRHLAVGVNPECRLSGNDSNTWGYLNSFMKPNTRPANLQDLARLAKPSSSDAISDFISKCIIPAWQSIKKRASRRTKETYELIIYSENSIVRFTSRFATFLACLLPLGAIWLLYEYKDMITRLSIITGLTAFLSFVLLVLTDATRNEIFATTAGYVLLCEVTLRLCTNE